MSSAPDLARASLNTVHGSEPETIDWAEAELQDVKGVRVNEPIGDYGTRKPQRKR